MMMWTQRPSQGHSFLNMLRSCFYQTRLIFVCVCVLLLFPTIFISRGYIKRVSKFYHFFSYKKSPTHYVILTELASTAWSLPKWQLCSIKLSSCLPWLPQHNSEQSTKISLNHLLWCNSLGGRRYSNHHIHYSTMFIGH